VLAVFENTLAHEQKVTSLINDLFALTTQENDYATQSMLKWFIDEQVEEEENAQTIIDNLKMIKDNGYGLYMLDKELGTRTYSTPSPLAKGE
ncbi:MAG: ferritin-like domain-containing protein, partial [Prevotella sp.]|nr:ferritin-like domain-containing protein [Prevotella sp.]